MATLMERTCTLRKTNALAFRCRLNNCDGVDAHRTFSGSYYPRWRSLYLDEVKELNGKINLVHIQELEVVTKPSDGDYYFLEDFAVGLSLVIRGREYIITKIEAINLKDPSAAKQYSEYMRNVRNFPDAVVAKLTELRDAYINRAGSVEFGIKDAGRRFRILDDSGDRKVSKEEFQNSLAEVRVSMTSKEVDMVFTAFDKNRDGSISYEEFMNVLRGPMNERRRAVVKEAFCKVDADGDGIITVDDLRAKFDTRRHPAVKSGEMTEVQVLKGFLAAWDTINKDGKVEYAEFCDYYNGVSASIENDELFEMSVRGAWRL